MHSKLKIGSQFSMHAFSLCCLSLQHLPPAFTLPYLRQLYSPLLPCTCLPSDLSTEAQRAEVEALQEGAPPLLYQVFLYVVEVDIQPESRLLGHVDVSLIIHRVGDRVEPGRRFLVVDERMQ